MKLRNGWKSHGRFWRYMETPLGLSVESVVKFTERGVTWYEAHYSVNGICGFAYSPSDYYRTKRFSDREAAFMFCEEQYKQRTQSKL